MNKNMLPNQSISSHEKETFSSLKNKTANSSSARKQLEQKTSITITQKSIRSSEAITTFGKNVLLFLNFWKQNWAEKKTDSELSITYQSDFDHHAVKKIKKHCDAKSKRQFSCWLKVSKNNTAVYASTKNKTKNHYDYHAEKEIKNENNISHYQNKESFFMKIIVLKVKLRFMLRLRTKLGTIITITDQSIWLHELVSIFGVTKQVKEKLLLDFRQ